MYGAKELQIQLVYNHIVWIKIEEKVNKEEEKKWNPIK